MLSLRAHLKFSPVLPPGEKWTPRHEDRFGQGAVRFIQDVFHQATDPTMVLPMLLASPVYHVGKIGLLRSFLTKPAATYLGRALTLSVLPALGGFGAETMAFSLSSRGLTHFLNGPVSWDPGSIATDTLMTGMTLGFLKGAGFAGRKGMQWARDLNECQPQFWGKADHRAMFWTGQVSAYLGLVGAHGLQTSIFPETHMPGGNIWVDALGAHMALGLGAHGGRRLLGQRFYALEQGLAHQVRRLSQELRPLSPPRAVPALAWGMGNGDLNPISLNRALPHAPSEGVKPNDPFQQIIQEIRQRSANEIFRKCFSDKTEEELRSLIQEELTVPNRFGAMESKLIQIMFFSDSPKSLKETGLALGFSPERASDRAGGIVKKIKERIIDRLAYRLYPSEDPFEIPAEIIPGSARVRNFIKKNDIKTLGQLAQWTEKDLLQLDNMGQRSLAQMKALLAERGLSLVSLAKRQRTSPPSDLHVLDTPVFALLLPSRVANILDSMKIRYLGELVQISDVDFLETKGAGSKSLRVITKVLALRDLSLEMDVGAWKPPKE